MKLANCFGFLVLMALAGAGSTVFAEKGVVIHCSDSKGAKLKIEGQSALEFAKSYGFADYYGPKTGYNLHTQIPMGCEVENSDSSYNLDPEFKTPKIECFNLGTLVMVYRKPELGHPGNPLIATITETDWPGQPRFVTEMVCDK